MEPDYNFKDHKGVSCTEAPETVELIDYYASKRGLYRSNWLREAISEKLRREIEAETGLKLSKAGGA